MILWFHDYFHWKLERNTKRIDFFLFLDDNLMLISSCFKWILLFERNFCVSFFKLRFYQRKYYFWSIFLSFFCFLFSSYSLFCGEFVVNFLFIPQIFEIKTWNVWKSFESSEIKLMKTKCEDNCWMIIHQSFFFCFFSILSF